MRRLVFLLLLVASLGCNSAARFDGSSAEAAEASIERMTQGMSPAEAQEFGQAVAAIITPKMVQGTTSEANLFSDLHGLTAEQIIAKGKSRP